jgi:hypothetical protein
MKNLAFAIGDFDTGENGATSLKEFEIRPDPDDPRLSVNVPGIDHEGQRWRLPSSPSGRLRSISIARRS